MPRVSRIAFENGFFHIFNRGLAKQDIFVEDSDYKHFLTKLQELKDKKEFDHFVYAYVLMPNHFHLLVQTRKVPIATIMSSLLTAYSMYFNLKYQRVGTLFQNRFKSKLCDRDTYFLGASRYIMLNPVEGGLVANPLEYPWSSYQELFGKSAFKILDDKEISRLIGKSVSERKNYHKFILEGLPVIKELGKQYTFQKQIEGSPRFNVKIQKQFLRDKIRDKIEGLFRIRT